MLVSPCKGFYVIVPLEYSELRCIPARDLIVITMEYLNIPYYAGLLTAAEYHGATHQRVRAFQVITSKKMTKRWVFGHVWIDFIYKKDMEKTTLEKRKVEAGYLNVSTVEETVKDIMSYRRSAGGLNHQATVLSELIASISPRKLVTLAKRSKKFFWLQRVGYIIENSDTMYREKKDKLLTALKSFLARQRIRYVPLAPEITTRNKTRNEKWKIIENTTIESDL